MDEYFREHFKHEEQEMTAEDSEVADIMDHEIKETLASDLIEQSNLDAEIDEAKMFLQNDRNEFSPGLALNEVDSQVCPKDEAHYLFRPISSEIISYKPKGNSSSDTKEPRKSATIPSTTESGVDVHAIVRNLMDDSDFSRHVCSHHRQQMVEIMDLIKDYLSRCVSLTSDRDNDDLFGGDQRAADTECQGKYGKFFSYDNFLICHLYKCRLKSRQTHISMWSLCFVLVLNLILNVGTPKYLARL